MSALDFDFGDNAESNTQASKTKTKKAKTAKQESESFPAESVKKSKSLFSNPKAGFQLEASGSSDDLFNPESPKHQPTNTKGKKKENKAAADAEIPMPVSDNEEDLIIESSVKTKKQPKASKAKKTKAKAAEAESAAVPADTKKKLDTKVSKSLEEPGKDLGILGAIGGGRSSAEDGASGKKTRSPIKFPAIASPVKPAFAFAGDDEPVMDDGDAPAMEDIFAPKPEPVPTKKSAPKTGAADSSFTSGLFNIGLGKGGKRSSQETSAVHADMGVSQQEIVNTNDEEFEFGEKKKTEKSKQKKKDSETEDNIFRQPLDALAKVSTKTSNTKNSTTDAEPDERVKSSLDSLSKAAAKTTANSKAVKSEEDSKFKNTLDVLSKSASRTSSPNKASKESLKAQVDADEAEEERTEKTKKSAKAGSANKSARKASPAKPKAENMSLAMFDDVEEEDPFGAITPRSPHN